ncbi:hypothetical protein ON010_g10231 [Phytophthora cinnamomi]|nr:hypothetical protein ON010_g10231 [Phytophthora cinnamomi]
MSMPNWNTACYVSRRCCSALASTYVAQAAQQARGGGEPVIRNLASAFGSAAEASEKKKLRTITVEQQSRLNELVAEWIARHFRPMVIVEDEGFITFIRYITENVCGIQVDLPYRGKVRHEILCLAVAYRRRARDAIEAGCSFFSMTFDIWTSRNAKSYISLTIHYVDNDFQPHN